MWLPAYFRSYCITVSASRMMSSAAGKYRDRILGIGHNAIFHIISNVSNTILPWDASVCVIKYTENKVINIRKQKGIVKSYIPLASVIRYHGSLVFTCHFFRFAVWFSSVLPNKRWIIVGRFPRFRLLVSGCIRQQQFGLLVVADKFSELLLHSRRLHPSTQPAQCPLCLIYPSFGNQPYRGLWHLREAHHL